MVSVQSSLRIGGSEFQSYISHTLDQRVFCGLQRRSVLAKPDLLVFCGPGNGVARQPHNLDFVLAAQLPGQLAYLEIGN